MTKHPHFGVAPSMKHAVTTPNKPDTQLVSGGREKERANAKKSTAMHAKGQSGGGSAPAHHKHMNVSNKSGWDSIPKDVMNGHWDK